MAKKVLKRVEYTAHGLRRRIQRGIFHSEVVQTIRRPDKANLPTGAGRKHVRKAFRGLGTIHVVYVDQPSRYLVVTTWK